MLYPYSITINKCNSNCNTISDPYAELCVSDTIKNINVKVFDLMSRTNETRHIDIYLLLLFIIIIIIYLFTI